MVYSLDSLRFKQLDNNAVLPIRETPSSAGLDIFSIEDLSIETRSRVVVGTGLAVAIPEGYYGRLAPCSGPAANEGIDILAGVIDADYRGEIVCILYNTSEKMVRFTKGSKICQLIIEEIITPTPMWAEDLDKTSRGNEGFAKAVQVLQI